jgi:hypothetical protein
MHPESCYPGYTVARVIGLTIAGIIGAVIIAFLFGWLVMLLWNWLLPPLFHVGTIGYWQGFGLVILAKIFFGGMGGHAHDHGYRRWKREARSWAKYGGVPDPEGRRYSRHWDDWGADEWAPKGSYRNWNRYGEYWRSEGKAAFEAWLDKQDQGPKDESKDSRPDQPKAE